MIEDVRNVSGSLERFLLDRGETVVRLPARLMADLRRGARERGKSDPIDALAIARAALREGVDMLPTARVAGPELEIRLLGLHRERQQLRQRRGAGLLPEAYIAPRELRDTRELLRHRVTLVAMRSAIKNRVHAGASMRSSWRTRP